MSSLITLDIELDAIEAFIKMAMMSANSEYQKIADKAKAGGFSHFDDEANAYFIPQMCEEIAIKATLGELNALVEWELCNIASKPFQENKTTVIETVFDLKFQKIIKLIQNHYKIKFDDIACYEDFIAMRNKVNSFKHRKSFKCPRRDTCKTIPEKYEVRSGEVLQSIKSVRAFIKDLW